MRKNRPFPILRLFICCAIAFAAVQLAARPTAQPAADNAFAQDDAANETLFAALDLSLPELAAVKKAADAGDWALARRELAAHLRNRNVRTWHWPNGELPAANANMQIADNATSDKVQGGLVKIWHTFPDGKIDWYYNATRDKPPYNPEWQWQLNRMAFWREMARAYRNTKDERYPQAWVRQLHSFLEQCPAPQTVQNGRDSTWRTIEAGLRMSGSWPEAFHSFLHSPSVSDDDLAAYLYATLEHARYLSRFNTRANWLTMEMNGLYTAGVVFPELKEAAQWRQQVIDTLSGQARTQFLPDGAHYELTPGYHSVALNNILEPLQLAQAVGRENEFPQDYTAATEAAYDFLMQIMAPDRNSPRMNDSWSLNTQSYMRRALNYFPQRRDFRWLATDGKFGDIPQQTSFNLDWAGYLVMRENWQRDANYVLFDVGPLGLAHAHQDKLNVIFHPYGRELLFDSSGGSYEQSPWRRYAVDTFSHNTVLVDGLPQRRNTRDRKANVSKAAIDSGWQSTPQSDFGYGVYDEGYGEIGNRIATHTRRVLYAKPDIVIVADTLEPLDAKEHSYQARWHLLTTQTTLDPQTGITTTIDEGVPNMAVVPLLADGLHVATASAQTEPELLGWNVVKDSGIKEQPATTVTHTRSGSGIQRFVTLLLPQRSGQSRSVQQIKQSAPDIFEVTFTDGEIIHIEVSPEPTGAIRLERK